MIIMQLKFMLFVILTLLFATYSDCLKCYQNLDESKPKAIEITKEDTEVTCKAGDVCSTFVMKSYGKKSSYIRISSCKPKKNCEDVKKDDGKEFSGEEAYKKLESLFGPHDGESTAVSKAKILVKCCDKDMCNKFDINQVISASTKMARYFLGLALSITFLNVFFFINKHVF